MIPSKEELYKKHIEEYFNIARLSKFYNLTEYKISKLLHDYNIKIRSYSRFKDLTNSRFGRLKVLKLIGFVKRKATWECLCNCGKIIHANSNSLIRDNTKSCGCFKRDNLRKLYWKGYKDISIRFFNSIKRSAFKRNLEFNITIKQVWELFLKQNKKCALSGIDISFNKFSSNKNKITASLDRIDSLKGYTKDNIQWLHKDINRFKNNYSQYKFIEMCKLVVKNLKG